MEQLHLEQNSQEWLDARKKYRTASEAAIVLGISPFTSVDDFKLIKAGVKQQYYSAAMKQGHGQSLLPVLTDPSAPGRDPFVAEFHRHRFPAGQRIVWWDRYKYILNFADIGELYDLAADPAEMTNLIEEPSLKAVRDEMRARLLAHMLETDDNQGPQWQYILERPFQP